MNIFLSMVLLTPKQMIEKLNAYDGIILGATSYNNIIGLSNDFFVDKVLNAVSGKVVTLQYAFKPISKTRTLWLITSRDLDVFEDSKIALPKTAPNG